MPTSPGLGAPGAEVDMVRPGTAVQRAARACCLLTCLLVATVASSAPRPGEVLPGFSAQDLLGRTHQSQEWLGRRTLLVVLTDKDGGEQMRHWFETAATRVPTSVHRASLLSLRLPFFVSLGTARAHAKKDVPGDAWEDTWLDKNGGMARALELSSDPLPYAFALDERGKVLAAVHGRADSAEGLALLDLLAKP
ncbi:hypothetical protein [Myxococcus landrumensis]|uniref:Thioredoxin domain-containing protein n=1 Tax=Myxococcus landrumensis TaxID=2813577 RepID=A0ABX7N553_9BACT|nr:hypothetical protein [Myxococcus landrumus]QSQ13758.1 hypothetical protein JY572_36435 [Myxococcus landrumus]